MPQITDALYLELVKFFLSAVLGGIVGAALKIGSDEFSYLRSQSHSAQEKLRTYAKPLWRACDELMFRLSVIYQDLQLPDPNEWDKELKPLRWSPTDASSLRWYNEDGQYVVSTAYLIAALSSWIILFERDVVFLRFEKVSSTTRFFELLERLKRDLADDDSILYYDYFSGIGDKMISNEQNKPMSIGEFSYHLFQDELFRDYINQLFKFLEWVSQGNFTAQIGKAVATLEMIKEFLVDNGAIPEMGRKWHGSISANTDVR
jgi:hypothetical protein